MLGAHGVRSPRPPGSAGALVDGGPSDGDGDGDGGIVIDGGAYSTRARARGGSRRGWWGDGGGERLLIPDWVGGRGGEGGTGFRTASKFEAESYP